MFFWHALRISCGGATRYPSGSIPLPVSVVTRVRKVTTFYSGAAASSHDSGAFYFFSATAICLIVVLNPLHCRLNAFLDF